MYTNTYIPEVGRLNLRCADFHPGKKILSTFSRKSSVTHWRQPSACPKSKFSRSFSVTITISIVIPISRGNKLNGDMEQLWLRTDEMDMSFCQH